MQATQGRDDQPTLFGHPAGLFLLFFAEMWERFSYYGMRALLVFYMIKGFLEYDDNGAYKVYGAYTGLVYMTPFFGGMLADRLLGSKRAVVLGGLFMAAGHLMMTVEQSTFFYAALALLIIGNGFFKPNISTIVGSLYPEGSPLRDGGFTIFYMGINLGAAMSPLLCGYVGETYGWHYGFGLATIGMLFGLAVFMVPGFVGQTLTILCALLTAGSLGLSFYDMLDPGTMVFTNLGILAILVVAAIVAFTELKRDEQDKAPLLADAARFSRVGAMAIVLVGSIATAVVMVWIQDNPIAQVVVGCVSLALATAGVCGFLGLTRGGLPHGAGRAPNLERLHGSRFGPVTAEHLTYLGALCAVPVAAVLVNLNRTTKIVPKEILEGFEASSNVLANLAGTVLGELSTPTGVLLSLTGVGALTYLLSESFRSEKVERERLWVILSMMFFSLLFWAFFEQAGSSMNLFTDRNVDRVQEERAVTAEEVGSTLTIEVTQEQLGFVNTDPGFAARVNEALAEIEAKRDNGDEEKKEEGEKEDDVYRMKPGEPLTLTALDALREAKRDDGGKSESTLADGVPWRVSAENVGMGVGGTEVKATMYQATNPIMIIVFGLLLTALWGFLGKRGLEPSTPVKFALGLLQLGLGFVVLWYGAQTCDTRGMVGQQWLLLGYLLHTTGELCLSPVGLSMVTKLSPQRLVSTSMGAWFLATAFADFFSAVIATFTGVGHEGEGPKVVPVPIETVHVYGDVFGLIAAIAIACGVVCLVLAPLFAKWMHQDPSELSRPSGH